MLAIATSVEADESRLNVVLIQADDIGYSDLGCDGGEISTPHIDQLAKNGLRVRPVNRFSISDA